MTLARRFAELKAKGEKALVLFVTAGDPSLADLPEILAALEEGGADIIEIGLPFSDPIADGPVIQAASHRALTGGTTTDQIIATLGRIKVQVPLIAMGYTNTMIRKGYVRFAQDISSVGVSGCIVCDLVPDEAEQWQAAAAQSGIDTVFLAAPTSTQERLAMVCNASSGFVYAVARTGVTGMGSQDTDAEGLVTRLKGLTGLPVLLGFGISSPEDVANACRYADGAVIGSWLVDWLAANWQGGQGRPALVAEVNKLKNATRP